MSRVLRYIDSLYNDVTTLSSMSYYSLHIQITDLFIACYSAKDVWKKVNSCIGCGQYESVCPQL